MTGTPAKGFARALVVDDDDKLRVSLVRLVGQLCDDVREATSVARALQLLGEDSPDLVVTDVRLPDGSGMEVARAAAVLQPAPLIVAMSGLATAREAFELAQCGARLYLTKPFAPHELFDGIKSVRAALGEAQGTEPGKPDTFEQDLSWFATTYGVPDRELALLRLSLAGAPRERFPELLGVSENTCKTLTRRLLQRCDARSLADVSRLILLRLTPGRS